MSTERVRVKGVTIHRPIIYGNTATVLTPAERQKLVAPEHTHRWTVAVRSAYTKPDSSIVGGGDDIGYFIKRVVFKLHDSFANPTRTLDKPPYEITETGWGEFEIQIRIFFIQESGEKPITQYHHLKLHPWTLNGEPEIPALDHAIQMGPVHSWQYDEIVFTDPYQNFLTTLMNHPPTPLDKSRQRPVPFSQAHSNQASLTAAKGGVPEFTTTMEKEEFDRIEAARKEVIAEQDRLRAVLIDKEKELEKMRKQLAE